MLSDVLCEFTKSIGMETNMYAQLGGKLKTIYTCILKAPANSNKSFVSLICFNNPPPGGKLLQTLMRNLLCHVASKLGYA